LHGGSQKGAELIAAKWADARKVTQVAFKPDWTRHAKAAPFKRNDAMLDVLPVGVLVFPGTGIQEWTCHVFVPPQVLVYATLRSKATGLFHPSAEWRRRGL
jgi:hypothetical protein